MQFADLNTWNIPKQLPMPAQLPSGWSIVRVDEVVQQIQTRVKVEPTTEYKLIGVKWYGEGTFYRETVTGESSSATYLTPVVPGAFIYNRLFAWKTSFAIVPPEHAGCFVSNEFPQFLTDNNRLLPEYLYLYFTMDSTVEVVKGASIGSAAVSRNRFKEEEFLNFVIPLPPLAVQRAIVAEWQSAQAEIAAAEAKAQHLEVETWQTLSQELGRNTRTEKRPRAFALMWYDLDRWGVDIAWKTKKTSNTASYPLVRLGNLCEITSGGTPSRKNPGYFGGDIPWVKTGDVRNNIITETEETITIAGLANSSARLYPAGSLIVAMYGQGATRGRTAKLGIEATTNQACAVLTNFSDQIAPDFLWFYLTSEYDRLRELASGNNQPNLNAAIVADYSIPLPPLDIQREIVARVQARRAEIAALRAEIAARAQAAQARVAAAILGLAL